MEGNPSIVLNVLPISIGRFSAVPHWPVLGVPQSFDERSEGTLLAETVHFAVSRQPNEVPRLLARKRIQSLTFGEPLKIGDITLSFHPAGHILGSSQVRLEQAGEVWAVSGDYKLASDPTCQPFEPLQRHTFVTESTFALPIFRWPEPDPRPTGWNCP
jgi:Cft2 family RNA processing exonuclease